MQHDAEPLPEIPQPGEPTAYPAGSPGKIAALAARFARREPLFHPGDSAELAKVAATTHGAPRALPPGVTLQKGRYVARIGRERKYLGSFATAVEAAETVRLARTEATCDAGDGDDGTVV